MDYKVGQEVFICTEATYHNMKVAGSFQILKGYFISKANKQVCAKVELESKLLQETMICVPETDVASNFKAILDKVYTARETVIPVQLHSPS